jgi:hypothetical protein
MDAASVAFAKPFTWQLSDVSNIPGLNWVFFEAEKVCWYWFIRFIALS